MTGAHTSAGTRDTPLALLALPALVFFLIFAVAPLIGVVILSFTSWDGIGEILPNGLESWQMVLADPMTWNALGLTLATMVITWAVQTPLSILLGTFTAVLLNVLFHAHEKEQGESAAAAAPANGKAA